MQGESVQLQCLPSADAVAGEVARRMLDAAREAITARRRFALVLAGGRTPLAAYTLLAGREADWDHWHIFLGDERCLGPQDPGRNSVAVAGAWIERVPIPEENVHWIPAELGAEAAATGYEAVIAPVLPFDLVLLGMGEDGHTASLFPRHAIPRDSLVIPVRDAPKPPPERVSLAPRALTACREMLILVTGAEKREALDAWRRGADLPVARVASRGRARVLIDDAAAGGCSTLDDRPALS
jgi:6-phosphogluconolactonase